MSNVRSTGRQSAINADFIELQCHGKKLRIRPQAVAAIHESFNREDSRGCVINVGGVEYRVRGTIEDVTAGIGGGVLPLEAIVTPLSQQVGPAGKPGEAPPPAAPPAGTNAPLPAGADDDSL